MSIHDQLALVRKEFEALEAVPVDAPPGWYRERGYRLEALLEKLLLIDDLQPNISFRPVGEQIDGSFVLDSRVYLLEAKWQSERAPASSLYAFKGKVDGKLIGTVGIFIAINGFSTEAHDALRYGKELNVLLFDGDDLRTALHWGFAEALRVKLRAAAELGTAFYSLADLRGTVRKPEPPMPPGTIHGSSGPRLYHFIVEGRTDALIIRELAERLLDGKGDYDLRFQIAGGKFNIGLLANGSFADSAQRMQGGIAQKIILIADGDGDPEGTRKSILRELDAPLPLVVVDTAIEEWLMAVLVREGKTAADLKRLPRGIREDLLIRLISQLDLDALAASSASFRQFKDVLSG